MIKRFLPLMLVMMCLTILSATGQTNTKLTVAQVTESVTLSDNVDYIITSETPFAGDGVVNITNTAHAVLIFNALKPTEVLQ